jgi:hypothetical protein
MLVKPLRYWTKRKSKIYTQILKYLLFLKEKILQKNECSRENSEKIYFG